MAGSEGAVGAALVAGVAEVLAGEVGPAELRGKEILGRGACEAMIGGGAVPPA